MSNNNKNKNNNNNNNNNQNKMKNNNNNNNNNKNTNNNQKNNAPAGNNNNKYVRKTVIEPPKATGPLVPLIDRNEVGIELDENFLREEPVVPQVKEKTDGSEYYWNSYAHFGIHEEMIKDKVRTNSYRDAILNNTHLFKDKIVLDVGCGTGILSLFAAQAGAAHVYSIDASSIIEQAQVIVKRNNLENVITLIKGKAEEVELPVDKVDVIISEWMGYFLFYESMLDTVIFARDKWLKEGGVMLPDKASLSICGIEDAKYKDDKIDWWNRVYGFDMSNIRDLAMAEPLVDCVDDDQIITDHCQFLSVDLLKVKKEDLRFDAPFKLTGKYNDYCHALVVYFDIWFSQCHRPVHFSTGPHAQYTHWKQTVLYLHDVLYVSEGSTLVGTLAAKPNSRNPRDIDIKLHYIFEGSNGKIDHAQTYLLH